MAEWALGLDLGGTQLKGAALTKEGRVLAEETIHLGEAGADVWRKASLGLLRTWEERLGPASAAGAAAPGLAKSDGTSILWMAGRRADVAGVDWSEVLGRPHFVPVLNDAQAALLGEQWIGAARDHQNCILLTLGTGVGGAAMVDGQILKGAMGRAGHLGHICLDPYGPLDVARTPGSLELAIGDATVPSRTQGRWKDSKSLVAAVEEGVPEAVEAWGRSVRALGCAIASFVNILDPSLVILGGGVARAGKTLLDPLALALDETEWRPTGTQVEVALAQLGGAAGAIGAARRGWQVQLGAMA